MDRIEQLKTFLQKEPNDAFLNYAIALEWVKQNKLELALERFEWLQKNEPDYVALYYHFGKTLEADEQFWGAREMYQEGIGVSAKMGDDHANSELKGALELLENSIDFEED